MPKSGAVWLLHPSEELRGHIESRCAERGLLIITGEVHYSDGDSDTHTKFFRRLWSHYGKNMSASIFNTQIRKPQVLPPSEQMKKLRVVSEGLEARIYPVDAATADPMDLNQAMFDRDR